MKILYDYQIFEAQEFGGVSRYFYELINRLKADFQWELPIRYTANEYIKQLPYLKDKISKKPDFYSEFLLGKTFRGKKQLYNLKKKFIPEPYLSDVNKKRSIEHLKEGNFDVFHPTYYDDYFLDYLGTKPFVLTVYDMIYELYPDGLYIDHYSINKKKLAQKAAKVIAISENTKRDLVTIFGIEESKIEVIYLGNSIPSEASNSTELSQRLPDRYLLYVGGRFGYKNFYYFLMAILPLLRQDTNLHILCTGHLPGKKERRFLEDIGMVGRIQFQFVDDLSLATLYKNALAFVFPSVYEGFGIPIVEAFSCGCPVVASNTSSLSEIGGHAAIYFDPYNKNSIIEALNKIIYDEGLRNHLRVAGYEQLKKFSWDKTARLTQSVYKSVVNQKGNN